MGPESMTCQNCKSQFTLDPEDSAFYSKINVPWPTFCPSCRFQRRLSLWNALHLYKRPCDRCKKFNISSFPPEAPYTVYCPTCWWSDDWDARDYGREYDFSRPFFEQLNELWHRVPLMGLSMDLTTLKTSPFNHDAGFLKNCYLIFHGLSVEDSAYGYALGHSQMLFDCCAVEQAQYCYDSMHSYQANKCVGTRKQLAQSIECFFCRDSQNCQNCFASANLKSKQYWAWNKPLSKEEYQKELAKWDTGSYKAYKELQKKAEAHWQTQMVKSEYNEFVTNCTGPNIFFSKNAKDCIEVSNCEDCRYMFSMFGPSNKDCYDVSMWGNNLALAYEGMNIGENSVQLKFCTESGLNLSDAEYCKSSVGGSHHFGCVSMRKGNYVILNRPYSKEDYEKLIPRIKAHMNEMPYTDPRGNVYRYGEFFPPEFSPFAYNTTLAQNFFPLTKEQILEKKYAWREDDFEKQEATMQTRDVPDHIKNAPDSIIDEKIACEKCGRPYRIIEMELKFHRTMNAPLPRECPMCRINEKVNMWVKDNERNNRICSGCGKTMESQYREEEAPQVFCRNCYIERLD